MNFAGLWQATFFTLLQAILSALACVFVGLIAAPGYARLGRFETPVKWFLFFPSLASPVLIILALLLTINNFPYGLQGILLGHIFLNGGLCVVWIGEEWKRAELRWGPVSQLLGARHLFFIRKVIFHHIWRTLFFSFAVVCSFCLASFAIPLVLGGGPANSTLEVLIYEHLRASGDIQSALFVAAVEVLLQVMIFIILLRGFSQKDPSKIRPLAKLNFFTPWSLGFVLYCALGSLPFFSLVVASVANISSLHEILKLAGFKDAVWNSLIVSITVAIFLLGTVGFLFIREIKSLVVKWPTASGVVVGLGLLLILNQISKSSSRVWFIMFLFLGHIVVIVPPVLRLAVPRAREVQKKFKSVLVQLGADPFLSLRRIYFPLERRFFFSVAGLGAIWSLGEFSVGRVLSGEFLTVPVFIESLLSSYRLEAASSISLLFIGVTLGSLILFEMVINGLY